MTYCTDSLINQYHELVSANKMTSDPNQLAALKILNKLLNKLNKPASILPNLIPIKNLFGLNNLKGVYLYGSVGGGKTFVMDLFYQNINSSQKKRLHFHRFMLYVHESLTKYAAAKTENPIAKIAYDFAKDNKVLCLDELYVQDIADACVLAQLFSNLIKLDVVLVITSNLAPDDLYKNGLARDKFLPAIDLLNKHTQVVALNGAKDYRLRLLEQAQIYLYPNDENSEYKLLDFFKKLAPDYILGEDNKDLSLKVNNRQIKVKHLADSVIWLEFSELCDTPRSQLDYIELAKCFHTVLISNLTELTKKEDVARRFIALVDEFYSRNVTMLISAAVSLDKLYTAGNLKFEFERTKSRLIEMQSTEYMKRPHLS